MKGEDTMFPNTTAVTPSPEDELIKMQLLDDEDRLQDLLYDIFNPVDDFDTFLEVNKLINDIMAAISAGLSFENYFDFISSGAFKEVYALPGKLGEKWVLKVASNANPTEREQLLVECARNEGLADLFPATYFIRLASTINMGPIRDSLDTSEFGTYLTTPDGSYTFIEDNDSPSLLSNTLIFQRKCDIASHLNHDPHHGNDMLEHNGRSECFYELAEASRVEDYDWIHDFVVMYGWDKFYALSEFVSAHNMSDMRPCNLGYADGIPVITDWLSD